MDFLGLAQGDLYRTANSAAVAAIKDIYPLTAASGNEWGGRVYRSILLLMKQRHAFNASDISELRLENICSKAKLSTYCPNLLREVIN